MPVNREIKFRAWDKESRIMYPNVQNHIGNEETAFGHMLRNDKYIIEQFTGLKDKNGKEIFEGDIVQHVSGVRDFTEVRVIEFKNGSFVIVWNSKDCSRYQKEQEGWGDVLLKNASLRNNSLEEARVWTIIGNIHEHAHLLETANASK